MTITVLRKRCLPSLPIPISPSAVSPPTHFVLYHFAPLLPRPFIFLRTYHFALLPFHPLPIRPMLSRLFYHFAHSPLRPMPFCPFIISPLYHFITLFQFLLKLLTTAHDFLVLEPKQLPRTG